MRFLLFQNYALVNIRVMSQNTQTNNKRIAQNTLYLYLRMFISLALSLVTGRVVLQTLGVEDYGINAVAVSYTHLTLPTNREV